MGNNPNLSETVRELMDDSGLDRTTCEELVHGFVAQAQRLIIDIKDSIIKNDLKRTDLFLHQLKGSAGNIRAREISRLALEAEGARKAIDVNKVGGLLQEIEEILKTSLLTGKEDNDD